ncbi:hypothetical protein GCM10018787_08950 [Streptomyces thermodiastaticus]|nr:hypothetical protein GCM10018787_08950 [Streptomyces thermodiastaticus]
MDRQANRRGRAAGTAPDAAGGPRAAPDGTSVRKERMSDPTAASRAPGRVLDGAGAESRQVRDAVRDFVETVTFATADEIVAMPREVLAEDVTALPPWARRLACRLACLQRPGDPELLRQAAADLLCFGPDRDEQAEELTRRAEELEQQRCAGERRGPPPGGDRGGGPR